MNKWIALVLLAGLTACTSNAAPDESEPAETTAASDISPVPEGTGALEATPGTTEESASQADAKPAGGAQATTGAKLKPGLYAHFETSLGSFIAELKEKDAPITVANFAGLASGEKEWTDPRTGQKQKKPYYNGLIFHRIIDGFMIQGGDPLGNGTGGPGFTIKDEVNGLRHDRVGTLAMARTQAPDSAGSQFYITVAATTFLDNQRPPYVVFGQVVEGLDIVTKIGKVPTGAQDRPVTPVVIKEIRIERVQ